MHGRVCGVDGNRYHGGWPINVRVCMCVRVGVRVRVFVCVRACMRVRKSGIGCSVLTRVLQCFARVLQKRAHTLQ